MVVVWVRREKGMSVRSGRNFWFSKSSMVDGGRGAGAQQDVAEDRSKHILIQCTHSLLRNDFENNTWV